MIRNKSPHPIFHDSAKAASWEKEVRPKSGFGSKPKKLLRGEIRSSGGGIDELTIVPIQKLFWLTSAALMK